MESRSNRGGLTLGIGISVDICVLAFRIKTLSAPSRRRRENLAQEQEGSTKQGNSSEHFGLKITSTFDMTISQDDRILKPIQTGRGS